MDKIPFEDGTKLKSATVTVNEQEYEVTPAQYKGKTPLSSFNLNKMQDNIENTLVKASATEPNSDVWIKHSINMLKTNISSLSSYGITGTNKEDGSILVSGNATSSNIYLIGLKKINKEVLNLGDYTLSINNEEIMSDVSVRLRKVSISGSKTEIITQALDTVNKEISLNYSNLVGSDTSYIELDLYLKTQKQYSFTIYPQFQRGKATKYESPLEDDILVNNNGVYISVLTSFKQNAITATMTNNQSITTTSAYQVVKVNLDTITSSSKLSLSGNAIKIGKGVNKILVSANTSFVEKTDGLVNLQFLKNSKTVGKTVQGMSDQARLNISAPPQLIEVSEGDLIYMCLAFGNTQTGKTVSSSSTFMTVQVIE